MSMLLLMLFYTYSAFSSYCLAFTSIHLFAIYDNVFVVSQWMGKMLQKEKKTLHESAYNKQKKQQQHRERKKRL